MTPFLINFRSDAFEFTDGAAIAEAGDAQTGFRYTFTQVLKVFEGENTL